MWRQRAPAQGPAPELSKDNWAAWGLHGSRACRPGAAALLHSCQFQGYLLLSYPDFSSLQRRRAHDQLTQSPAGEERVMDLNPFSWDQRQRMAQGAAEEQVQREAATALQFAWDPMSRDGAQPQGGSGRPDPRRFRDIGRFMRQNVDSTTRQRCTTSGGPGLCTSLA